jgi:uncharacterized protein (DUF1501 family)
MPYTRRDFLKHGALFVALGMTAPAFLARTALASEGPVTRALRSAGLPLPTPAPNPKNVLVVVQLGGGNDGLNTIVPIGDDRYYAARPTLAIPRDQALPLGDGLGLAPGLAALKPLYDANQVTIIQGVGYPNPSRSHFRSMEIWQTGSPTTSEHTGWLGRYLDANCCGEDDPLRAVNIGGGLTRSLWTDHTLVPSIAAIEGFQFPTDKSRPEDRDHQLAAFIELYGAPSANHPHEEQVRRVGQEFQATAEQLKQIAATYRSTVDYPQNQFAQGLRQIAQVLSADLGTRVAYVSLGGFDTHANQARAHGVLLKTLADGLAAFQRDLEGLGLADRVAVLCFSEFGRRVGENGSLGTDHGAAAPLLLIGAGLRGGLLGAHPSLEDLGDGDLKHGLDFRQAYATLLQGWLGADPTAVLGGEFAPLPLLR